MLMMGRGSSFFICGKIGIRGSVLIIVFIASSTVRGSASDYGVGRLVGGWHWIGLMVVSGRRFWKLKWGGSSSGLCLAVSGRGLMGSWGRAGCF